MKTFASPAAVPAATPARSPSPGARAAVRQRLSTPQIQPQLEIGPANDAYEREADAVADRVMRMPDPTASSSLQRMCADCEEGEEG